MNKLTKYIFVTVALIAAVFSCTEDRDIENNMPMSEVRQIINQNFSDLLDSVEQHTVILQSIDYIGIQDSLSAHRTIIESLIAGDIAIDLRIDALEAIDHSHPNLSVLNSITEPFTTGLKSTYDNYATDISLHGDAILDILDSLMDHTNKLTAQLDSLQRHTDSIEAVKYRVGVLEGYIVTGTSTYCVEYICTVDTSSTSPASTGYFILIPEAVDNYKLTVVEAKGANSQGDMTLSANVWRDRGGVESVMTTTGASLTANAVVDAANDDVQTGDRLEIRWTYTGGTEAADGLMVVLTFQPQ